MLLLVLFLFIFWLILGCHSQFSQTSTNIPISSTAVYDFQSDTICQLIVYNTTTNTGIPSGGASPQTLSFSTNGTIVNISMDSYGQIYNVFIKPISN